MVKKITVIDIKNETDEETNDETIDVADNEPTKDEEINVVAFDAKPAKNIKQPTKQKTVEQHQCSDCGKYMSLKTLRYSHDR